MLGGACALGLAACSATPETRIPARAAVFGQRVDTTVDSDLARYYLEQYLQGRGADKTAQARIDALYRRFANSLPSRDELNEVAAEFSVDFAALFLADRLLASTCNRALAEAFAQSLDDKSASLPDTSRFLMLFVPGWDYVDNGALTGADFAEPRRLVSALGIENRLVELAPTASVEENAGMVAAAISQGAGSGKEILLAGASSAAPAIHLAIGDMLGDAERRAVRAWLNLSGLLQGSPVVDHYRQKLPRWVFAAVAWWNDWKLESLLSMGTVPRRARFERLAVDPGTLVINYLGVPLSGQLSRYTRESYVLLRPLGPNDGLTLLTDAFMPGGLTIVALGSDHFLSEDPRINQKAVALLKLTLRILDDPAGTLRRCELPAR